VDIASANYNVQRKERTSLQLVMHPLLWVLLGNEEAGVLLEYYSELAETHTRNRSFLQLAL